MYGELNFNPILFVAQMKYIVLPLTILILTTLFVYGTYSDYKQRKNNKETEETETC